MKTAPRVLLALLILPLAGEAVAEFVNREFILPLESVEQREDGSYGLLSVGIRHGVVQGGLRPYLRRFGKGAFEFMGSVELLGVADSSCTVLLSEVAGDSLRSDDLIELRFWLESPPERQLSWEFARHGMRIHDLYGDPILDFHLANGPFRARLDSLVYERSLACVRDLLPIAAEMDTLLTPLTAGRYRGRSAYEVLTATTPAAIEDFFQYMHGYPEKYRGQSFNFADIYATWLINNAPASPEEAMSVGLAEGLDTFRARLPEFLNLIGDPAGDDHWPLHWYERVREHWRKDRHQECLDQLGIFRAACEYVETPRWWHLHWNALADILDSNEEQEGAIDAYRKAIDAAEGNRRSLGVSHNNLASSLKDLERFEEAALHYVEALKHYGAWEDPDAAPHAATSWAQLARSRRALGDYDGATQAFEISARLYGAQGNLHGLQQRHHDLSDLGEMHKEHGRNREAIEAWRRGLETTRELGWRATVADALDDMSDGHWNLGEVNQAIELRLEAAGIHGEVGEFWDQAYTFSSLAIFYSSLGEQELATEYYRLTIESHRGREEWYELAGAYYIFGLMERSFGNYDEALVHLNEAERLYLEHGGEAEDLARLHLERAEVAEGRGQGAIADSLYTLAEIGFRESGNVMEGAHTLTWWGNSLTRRQEQNRALAKLEAALSLWEEADDLGGLCDAKLGLADFHYSIRGDQVHARSYIEEALAHSREMPDKKRESEVLVTRSNQFLAQGKVDSAFVDQRRVIELHLETGNLQGRIDALTTLGGLHAKRGEVERGLAQLDETLVMAEAAGLPSSVAYALRRRAWFGQLYGHYDQAREDAQHAIEIDRKHGNEAGVRSALNTLAAIEQDLGNFDAALRHFEEYRVLAESCQELSSLAAYHNNVGNLHESIGNDERAENHYLTAIEYSERRGFVIGITTAYANLSGVQLRLGKGEQALEMSERSIESALALQLEPRIIITRVQQGRILRKLGRWDEALAALTPLLPRARDAGLQRSVIEIQTELGILDWQGGDQPGAQSALAEAIVGAREFGSIGMLWQPLLHMARSRRDAGDPEVALLSYREALNSLETVRGSLADEEQGARFQEKHGDVYRELVDLLLDLGREEEAWSVIGLMKSDELRGLNLRTRMADLDEPERALMEEAELLLSREARLSVRLTEELARPTAERHNELIDELRAEIKSYKKKFRGFIRGLDREHGKLVKRLEIKPSNLMILKEQLGEQEAFLEPLQLPDRLVLFLVRGDDTPMVYREVPVIEARVDSLIEAMRESLSRPASSWQLERAARLAGRPRLGPARDPAGPAGELHALLIAPLLGDLQGVEQLIVSPSGRLRYIPFPALHDGESYLLERFTISTMTQAGAMGRHETLSPDPPLLAFGNPDASLIGAEREVQGLAQLWNPIPVTTVFGDSATAERLETELDDIDRDFRILHLASHGKLSTERPEESFILLGGKGAETKLGILDIVTLSLTDIELAVLSACETGLGDEGLGAGDGREITSLAHTFEETGTAAVIASLWSVNDQSTKQLMLDLYSALREPPVTRAGALRKAQLAMLRGEEFAHPYYWAPFILIGDWH